MNLLPPRRSLAVTAPLAVHATNYTFTDNSDFSDVLHGTAYTRGLDQTSAANGTNAQTGVALNALETAIKTGGQTVTGATLTLTGVNDWTSEPADVLYVDLLNNLSTANHGANTYQYDSSPDGYDVTYGVDPFVSSTSHTSSYYEITHGITTGGHTYGGTAATSGSLLQYTVADGAVYTGAGKNDVSGNPGTWSDPVGGGGAGDSFTLVIQLTAANLAVLDGYLTSDETGGATAGDDLGIGLGPDCHYTIDGLSFSITTSGASVPDGGLTVTLMGLALIGLAAAGRFMRRSFQA